jgi:hypothetical protein
MAKRGPQTPEAKARAAATLNRGGNDGNKFGAGRKEGTTQGNKQALMAKAAVMAANGASHTEIAEAVDRAPDTICEWAQTDEFKRLVQEQLDAARKVILETGIADRVERVKRLGKRWNQINEVFQARANDPGHISVPGWDTGLLCHEQKSLGSGDLATVVDVYKVDTATIKEEREISKQAAQELGQWTEKVQTSYDLSNLSDEELEALERISNKLAKP